MSMTEEYLDLAIRAAQAAGDFIIEHAADDKKVDEATAYDIKLELDVKSQDLITEMILKEFPQHAIYGEEGIAGDQSSEYHWIVDPIDGTVNFFYGIPHYCVSIALRRGDEIIVGVVYDPNMKEMWSATRGGGAFMNGQPIKVSSRKEPKDAVVTIGFSKSKESIDAGLERYKKVVYEVRKTRMFGSAALAMAYIASGRLDAYVEEVISLWDIAAGWLLIDEAGGTVALTECQHGEEDKYSIVTTNGHLQGYFDNVAKS